MASGISDIINLIETLDVKKESIATKSLLDKAGSSISLFTFDKAQGLGKHTSPFVNCYYLIEGKAEITIDGVSSIIGENEFVTIPAETATSLHAIHKVRALHIQLKS